MFSNRLEAGRLLGEELLRRNVQADLVVAIPRGGLGVAEPVAAALGVPLDIVIVRKLGAPGNPEYAIGAVDPDGTVELTTRGWADDAYVRSESRRVLEEIRRREHMYRAGTPAAALTNKRVILVDDGVATGATAVRAIAYVKRCGARSVVFATPVAPASGVEALRAAADSVVVLESPKEFWAVSQAYQQFLQMTDAEVVASLARSRTRG